MSLVTVWRQQPRLTTRSQPKSAAKPQPKPANATKGTASKVAGRGRGRARGRNAGRGKPKTAQELDAEMQDYFEVNGTTGGEVDSAMETNGGAVQPAATGGDTGMDDEILVSSSRQVNSLTSVG